MEISLANERVYGDLRLTKEMCIRDRARDPRMKERKKYGLKAARRAPQFSKR